MTRLISQYALSLLILTLGVMGCASSNVDYLALGDSYTIGESVDASERWPVQLVAALQDSGVTISGPRIIAQTGWTTTDLQEAMDKAELQPPYKLVSLLIGVNDQYQGRNINAYPARFEKLLQQALILADSKPQRVFVISIPDYSVTPFAEDRNTAKIARELVDYNSINQEIAREYGVRFINITPGSRQAADDASLVASDGLHPSGKMYSQWVDKILPVVLEQLRTQQSQNASDN